MSLPTINELNERIDNAYGLYILHQISEKEYKRFKLETGMEIVRLQTQQTA